ncbi:hypothetical protein [Desulfovibrio litoralis]|uniref:Uncharacterized protein n=1 Tax=Desulfovibrio litoralis DSM 11393 TaxID=1121455 RepID=A0A1M7TP97_9BACT|nr:hypothetical protein [Desulfovibrio litoralis]SHN72453.1 hypothetical protein SAMN02745728_02319 [Desulfovibrio litoralis DSM 11393]
MLIILQKDLHTLNDGSTEFLEKLGDVITSNRLGNHLVLGDTKTIRALRTFDIGKPAKEELQKIENISRDVLSTIRTKIDKCISIASYKGNSCKLLEEIHADQLIDFALEDFTTYNFNNSITLLAEDLRDCDVFNFFCQSYIKFIELEKIAKVSNRCINGGGNSTGRSFDICKNTKQPVICIKDGDIKEPPSENTSNETETEEHQNDIYSYLFQYHKLKIHEIENAIPLHILQKALSARHPVFFNFIQTRHNFNKENILSYIDFKDGIRKENMRKRSISYQNIIKEILIQNNFATEEQFTCLEQDCRKNINPNQQVCPNCSIIAGSGKHTLEKCLTVMKNEGVGNLYTELRETVQSSLTPLLKKIISLSLAAKPSATVY